MTKIALEHFSAPSELDSGAENDRATAGLLALEIMHEIRNSLEMLGHLNYLAYQEADHPEKVRAYMRMAEEQLRHLNRIASQTLRFAEPSQERTPIELVTLAESALRIHQQTIQAKRIHLVRKLPNKLVATIQSSRILQVLSNFIANALEAMPEEGRLTVSVKRCSGCVELLVADNGSGIHPDFMAKLFQPFFTTKQYAGNGLGLSLSKRIIEEHKGKLFVRFSVRPGRTARPASRGQRYLSGATQARFVAYRFPRTPSKSAHSRTYVGYTNHGHEITTVGPLRSSELIMTDRSSNEESPWIRETPVLGRSGRSRHSGATACNRDSVRSFEPTHGLAGTGSVPTPLQPDGIAGRRFGGGRGERLPRSRSL